jgi:hypothetical protein
MRGASFRDLAGAELEPEDVERMLELDETLFVEHKGAEPEYQLAKAVADCDRLAEHVHHIQPIERAASATRSRTYARSASRTILNCTASG